MILAKRPEIDRFLKAPDPAIRAAVIHGKDRSGVTERALTLYKAITPDLNDPFNVTVLTDSDIDSEESKLEEALTAMSLMGGRRLVRIRLSALKPGVDKAVAAAAAGTEATIQMQARKGRASYLGERSIGHQDAGATSTLLLLTALRDRARL